MRNEEGPPILYSSLRRSMEVMEARGISSGILDFLRFVLDVLPMQVTNYYEQGNRLEK